MKTCFGTMFHGSRAVSAVIGLSSTEQLVGHQQLEERDTKS